MRTYIADLETTVFEGQTYTEAWASALVDIKSPNETSSVTILHSLSDTLDYLTAQNENAILYYHNLKFDGQFWLSYLLNVKHFTQGIEYLSPTDIVMKRPKNLKNNEVIYSISDMGQWYTITFKYRSHVYTLKDSLKLLPFSVKAIGDSFKTKHRKLEMEYEGYRYAGCKITDDEKEYIANDVLVVKEALEVMFSEGHNSLTIGGCCLKEFKSIIGQEDYKTFFPPLHEIMLDKSIYDASTADEYIRNSYRGGWCYRVKGAERIECKQGVTADVNSLYPSMMHSQSGNRYPVGKPYFWSGNYIPAQATSNNHYYFIRIRTRFKLKEGKLPFIQIKHNPLYKSTEMLETSDVYDKESQTYSRYIYTIDGQKKDTQVELTLTCTDYELLQEHYNLFDFEILDGCWFFSEIGIFDEYINKYKQIKMTSKGALRMIAKLFLNNLYGKLATSKISSFKYAELDEEGIINFHIQEEENKEPIYIAIGSAITSYSRNFTIRAAQHNYYGHDKRGFKYADTDSIHCDIPASKLKGIRIDDNDFCAWKLEAYWDSAIFIRQKTYVEHVTHEDRKPIEHPYYNIKCAGMPDKCKNLFIESMSPVTEEQLSQHTYNEQLFLKSKRTIDDFTFGLTIPGKLLPRTIKGGVILEDSNFTLLK